MLSSLLVPLVCAALPALDPLDIQASATLGRAHIVVGIQITATQFRARNLSSIPQIFVFKEAAGGEIALCPLSAGGEMLFSFPGDAFANLELEVVSRHHGAWSDTGLVKLGGLNAGAGSLVWIQSSTGRASAWLESQGDFVPLESSGSALPGPVAESMREGESLPPTHVPVITPSDHPSGDLPPKLEERPLPPV